MHSGGPIAGRHHPCPARGDRFASLRHHLRQIRLCRSTRCCWQPPDSRTHRGNSQISDSGYRNAVPFCHGKKACRTSIRNDSGYNPYRLPVFEQVPADGFEKY